MVERTTQLITNYAQRPVSVIAALDAPPATSLPKGEKPRDVNNGTRARGARSNRSQRPARAAAAAAAAAKQTRRQAITTFFASWAGYGMTATRRPEATHKFAERGRTTGHQAELFPKPGSPWLTFTTRFHQSTRAAAAAAAATQTAPGNLTTFFASWSGYRSPAPPQVRGRRQGVGGGPRP